MRQFNLTYRVDNAPSDGNPYSLALAYDYFCSWELLDGLAALNIGQTYIDSDGDTWERIA